MSQTLQINNKYNIYKYITLSSFVMIFLFGAAFLQPFSFNESANAEPADVDVSVAIEPTISISTDHDSVTMNVTPNDFDKVVTSDTVTINVGTNNPYGYTLSVATNGTNSALLKDGTNTNITIPALTDETTSTAWTSTASLTDKWGFTHDNTDLLASDTYLPVPASDATAQNIKETFSAATSSQTAVTFATKVGIDQPAGTYQNTVVFSAVANALPETRTLDDFEYMQDVDTDGTSADICENSTEWTTSNNKEYTLKDARDDNSYTIRKLADGNCWMTDNLRLINKTITSADSNMTSGEFIVPASSTDWGTSATKLNNKAYDTENSEYGVYYNWYTATAGTGDNGVTSTGANAPASICPKGWRLPTGGSNSELYNVAVAVFGQDAVVNHSVEDPDVFASSALSLPFSGLFSYGSTYDKGAAGGWWSSTAYYSSNYAYYLYVFSNGDLYPDRYSDRYYGLSVRCLLSSS